MWEFINSLPVWLKAIPRWLLALSASVFLVLILWSIFVSRNPFQLAGFNFGAVPQPGGIVPSGIIAPYWGKKAPEGWLLCNGAPIPDEPRYEGLRKIVGENVPDLGGLFVRGLDPKKQYDSENRALGHVQPADVGKHVHDFKVDGGEHAHTVSFTAAVAEHRDGDNTSHPGAHNKPFEISVGGGAHMHEGTAKENRGLETRPANIALNYIIKI